MMFSYSAVFDTTLFFLTPCYPFSKCNGFPAFFETFSVLRLFCHLEEGCSLGGSLPPLLEALSSSLLK